MNLIRQLLVCMIGLACTLTGAQTYPVKPVRIIVPYAAGQGTDIAARTIAERLAKSLGQAFFIDNKGGAGGNIGAADAARSAPDGYTFIMGTNATHVMNAFLYDHLSFDAEKDFEPVALVSTFPMLMVAGAQTGFKSLQDVLQAHQANAKAADCALPSTTARLVLDLLKDHTRQNLMGIPYKSSAAAASDLLGAQVPLAIDTVSATRAAVASGKMIPIAITSARQSALLPGVKTVAEQGVPGFEVIAWNALYAPKGTPADVIKRVSDEVGRILNQPDVVDKFLQIGHEPAGGTPEQLAQFAKSERQKWGPLIQKNGIKAN